MALVAWLILRASRQRGLLQAVTPTALPLRGPLPSITAIVPARDEQANITACLHGLIQQHYPTGRLNILVVDDHSADATACLATAIAKEHSHVGVLSCPPLPPLWIGKSHACWSGACAAPRTEWLCFIDADVRSEPGLLASAIVAACAAQIDLLSLAPRQELGSFAERLIMPCGLYLLAFCQDLRKLQARDSAEATATGQFMLVRADAYWAVGGHAAIHREICEDLALARLIKRSGRHVVLRDGSALVSTRMYSGWRTLWPGIVKNLVEMLGGPLPTLATASIAVLLAWAVWLVPIADGLSCSHGIPAGCMAMLPGLLGLLAAIGLHVAGAAHFRISPWYGLLFPLGYTAGALMALDSIRWRWRGRIAWKGRDYP